MKQYDVFISHASEDKLDVARPLASLLVQAGLSVWLDESELTIGDSLRRKIDQGLASCRFGLVVLSKAFFSKEWPQKELDALVAREDGTDKVLLPVWHNLDSGDIRKLSPLLADRLGARTSDGLPFVAASIVRAIVGAEPKLESQQTPPIANSTGGTAGPKRIDQLVLQFIDRMTEASNSAGEVAGVRSGFIDFDRMLGGFGAGELYICAARPAMGCSTFALNAAAHIAIAEGLPVLYFSSQATSQEILSHLIASTGRIDRRRLAVGQLSDDEWKRLTDATTAVHASPLYVDDSMHLTVDQVVENAKTVKSEAGALGFLVVDSLQTLAPLEASSEEAVLRKLRQLARELRCPVLLLMSASRSAEARSDKRPTAADLSCRDAIEHFATAVIYLYRDDYYNRESTNPGILEVIVGRNRGGVVGTVRLAFMKAIGRIENLTHESSRRPDEVGKPIA